MNFWWIILFVYVGILLYLVIDDYSYTGSLSKSFTDFLLWPVIAVFVFFGVVLPDWFEGVLEKIKERFE